MSEKDYKNKLREEIEYMRSHEIEEINKDLPWMGPAEAIERANKKKEYDAIPEEKIEEYINLSWIKHKNNQKINEMVAADTSIYRSVIRVEQAGPKETKLKNRVKEKIKEAIAILGPAVIGIDCIAAIVSLLVQDPVSLQSLLLASTAMAPVMLGFNLVMDGTIKEIYSTNKSVKILKEKGLYDDLTEKMEAETEMKNITNKGKAR